MDIQKIKTFETDRVVIRLATYNEKRDGDWVEWHSTYVADINGGTIMGRNHDTLKAANADFLKLVEIFGQEV